MGNQVCIEEVKTLRFVGKKRLCKGRFASSIAAGDQIYDGAASGHQPLLRFFGPGVLQGDGAVEHELAGGAVLIEGEIGQALELVAQFRRGVLQARLAFGGHDLQRVRVEWLEIAPGRAGSLGAGASGSRR